MLKKLTFLLIFLGISSTSFCADFDSLPWTKENLMEILLTLVPSEPNVLEAGSRFGEHTVWFAQKWPKSKIYTFEANPNYFPQITQATAPYQNIHFFPYGLSDKSGYYDFYISHFVVGGNSLLPSAEWKEDFYQDEKIRVYCKNLDEWFEEQSISQIDLVWFDLEGAELQILKGAPKTLLNTSIIYTEVNFQEFRKGMVQFDALYDFLIANGFILHAISGSNPHEQADAIFIKLKNLILN